MDCFGLCLAGDEVCDLVCDCLVFFFLLLVALFELVVTLVIFVWVVYCGGVFADELVY